MQKTQEPDCDQGEGHGTDLSENAATCTATPFPGSQAQRVSQKRTILDWKQSHACKEEARRYTVSTIYVQFLDKPPAVI
eukprot:1154528-Pelagomonas_calceolata.AAC.4